jgi:MerR family copper efflux transcriptional regulator
MRIGEFARRAGVTPSKVRFYEGRGLLPAADRSANGYRSFGVNDLQVIAFIDRARALGFTLADVTRFMRRPAGERRAKVGLAAALQEKLREIDAHLLEAQARRSAVVQMLAELGDDHTAR